MSFNGWVKRIATRDVQLGLACCLLRWMTACGESSSGSNVDHPELRDSAAGTEPGYDSATGQVAVGDDSGGPKEDAGSNPHREAATYDGPVSEGGDWVKLGTVHYDWPAGFNGTFDLRFWCKLAWDSDESRLLFYEGYLGDHGQAGGSIYANTVYSLTTDDATVHLLHLTETWQNPAYDSFVSNIKPPSEPHPRHTYGAFAYASGRHAIYLVSGACQHDMATCTLPGPDAWKYDVTGQQWSALPSVSDGRFGGYDGDLQKLPSEDKLWYFSPETSGSGWINVYSFDLNAEKWSAAIDYGNRVAALKGVAQDLAGNRFVVWIDNTNLLYFFDPKTQRLSPVPNVPVDFPHSGSTTAVSSNNLIIFYSPEAKEIWAFNPIKNVFTKVVHTSDPGKRIDRYLAYDPFARALVAFNVDNEFWLFRGTVLDACAGDGGC
jgi:hypothetical protein